MLASEAAVDIIMTLMLFLAQDVEDFGVASWCTDHGWRRRRLACRRLLSWRLL